MHAGPIMEPALGSLLESLLKQTDQTKLHGVPELAVGWTLATVLPLNSALSWFLLSGW